MEEKILTNKIQEIIFTGNPVLSINERLDEIKYNKNQLNKKKKRYHFRTGILLLTSIILFIFGCSFLFLFPERTAFYYIVMSIFVVLVSGLFCISYRIKTKTIYELYPLYKKTVSEEEKLNKLLEFYYTITSRSGILKRIKFSNGSGYYSKPYATVIYDEGIPFENKEKQFDLPLILKIAEPNSVNYNKLILNFDDCTITKYFTYDESKCDEVIFNTFNVNEVKIRTSDVVKDNKA